MYNYHSLATYIGHKWFLVGLYFANKAAHVLNLLAKHEISVHKKVEAYAH